MNIEKDKLEKYTNSYLRYLDKHGDNSEISSAKYILKTINQNSQGTDQSINKIITELYNKSSLTQKESIRSFLVYLKDKI